MSSLNKLAIRGIRSFDDKNIAVIEFFSPVTVIVGHNGSGKTTIIECLKYVTTGDQPPNTRGGAFVHDPNMANEKEVKAQVKLRFYAANGQRMLAVRNLSVTKKKNGLTMKTLEGILSAADVEKGKRGTISTKCAVMDAEMPNLLGVSKAVLENVIFCHQEDSYWPLAEASVLKKKFDDIFEATRYTKVLDSIKNLRKERMAEQKVEKERLESMSKEKANADKITKRLAELSAQIAAKQAEYEEKKKQYQEVVIANTRFKDQATHFRSVYMKLEQSEEKRTTVEAELNEMKLTLKEVSDTDEELEQRLRNFDGQLAVSNQKLRQQKLALNNEEETIKDLRDEHIKLVNDQATLQADQKRHEDNIKSRDSLIKQLGSKHGFQGFGDTPLSAERVAEFFTCLTDAQKKQNHDTRSLQSEEHSRNDEFSKKLQDLRVAFNGLRLKKDNIRNQITESQKKISKDDADLDATQNLPTELQHLTTTMEEKKAKQKKLQETFESMDYNTKIEEKAKQCREFEDRRDTLNSEVRSLNFQSESRAKLHLKQSEIKSKTQDIKNIMHVQSGKIKASLSIDSKPETFEQDVDQAIAEKEGEYHTAEENLNNATKHLQTIEATISNIQQQFSQKQTEMKAAEKKLKSEVDSADSVQAAIDEAMDEISVRKDTTSAVAGSSKVYESLLKQGRSKNLCTVCNRHLSDNEMIVFEKFLKDQIQKTSQANVEDVTNELKEWETELARLQELLPIETSRDRLKNIEIPALEQQKTDQEALVSDANSAVEKASEEGAEIRRQQKELGILKQHATTVSRIRREIETAKEEQATLETELSATGSTRSIDDVQQEIEKLSSDIRTLERDRTNITKERDASSANQRALEVELLRHQMQEEKLHGRLKDRQMTEDRINSNRALLANLHNQMKELDTQISTANTPIQELEEEQRQFQLTSNEKIAEAQAHSQEFNRSVDRMEQQNKLIMDYEKKRLGRKLIEISKQTDDIESRIADTQKGIEKARDECRTTEREIDSSGAILANLRENARFRKLTKDLKHINDEIASLDIEEAAKAKRQFDTKWATAQEREQNLNRESASLGGEISTMEKQLGSLREDQNEYKGITKKYTDQLVKVKVALCKVYIPIIIEQFKKMSDMANADLEKYAKALDDAIMKYHSLKMEEINDTMRHLWNKTYQGTDIDGIKIVSNNEGGATKRTYNYRVVMTKDQVEMDMRGRCSAGQKMLASIVIRLALADSFAQNCGILALDEPTNALDTENIDALAASLVDIINERKNQGNFQLIIITHDENFLRKLGQNDVMEYYWRVSRDSRQKSVIERERFT